MQQLAFRIRFVGPRRTGKWCGLRHGQTCDLPGEKTSQMNSPRLVEAIGLRVVHGILRNSLCGADLRFGAIAMTKIVLTSSDPLESNPNRNQASPQEEARWLAAIADLSEDAIIGKDLGGLVTAWRGAAEKMFGYTAEEIVGQPIAHIIPADRADEEDMILDQIRDGDTILRFETERRNKAGKPVLVSINLSPIRDDTSTIIGATELARDLTGLRRLSDDLKRREALLCSILDTVPDAMIVLDKSGIIQSFSSAAEQLFGCSAEEAVGQHSKMFRQSADWGQNGSYLQRYISSGEQSPNGIGRRKDGSTFPMAVTFGTVNLFGG